MCPVYRRASWADPHSIKEAMGRQQAQIAELMAETHARGEAAGVARLAAEKVNAAIIAAAKAKLVDMANVLHDTRSRNWEAAAEKIALEAGRKILVEVAKEQAYEPPRKVGVKSADVLGIASETPACEEEEEVVEEAFNPLSIR